MGLRWNVKDDKVGFGYKPELSDSRLTKREILRKSAKIYDPLGLLSPATIRSKLFLQDSWSRKLTWDQKIPSEIRTEWLNIDDDLNKCSIVSFPRRFFNQNTNSGEKPNLHVFTDASKSAYGACAYLVKGTESTFVMAKNHVAPLKQLTIPQLELMGALIGGRLASHILSSLQTVEKCILWSDSQIVLH